VAWWRRSVSPYSGGTVPDLHRSSLTARRLERESSIECLEAIALDLDAVLADTRPLWRDWLEDVARRTHVELDVPEDRTAAAGVLDERLGDWRPLLQRFADDRAPIHFRPRAETSAQLRRLHAAGVRLGAFADAPRELADVALAHVGAARRVEAVGTLDEVMQKLGAGAVVVRSRDELASLR
jgi:phosphoglycolate phosphatase-like HAD superfamily hydrolase